jgi:hypothetical protein
MKEVGSPILLFENLDLTPIHSILWTDLHRRPREARAPAEHGLLRLRGGMEMDGWARGCPASIGAWEALFGICSPLSTAFKGVLSCISLGTRLKERVISIPAILKSLIIEFTRARHESV